MEINITKFFKECAPMDYSASIAEIGYDAGPSTWRAAVEGAHDYNLLDTEDKKDAFKAFVRGSGGWDDEEIAAWSDQELTALFIQWISGDMREGDLDGPDRMSDEAWAEYEVKAQAGQVSSNLFKGIDGEIYFYAGL